MQINSYFVSEKEDKIRLLIEVKDNSDGKLSTLYYELVLRVIHGQDDDVDYEMESINEIYNALNYLYKNFHGDIKKRKLDPITNNYIVKVLYFQTHKPGFNERLVRRVNTYYNESVLPLEKTPRQ